MNDVFLSARTAPAAGGETHPIPDREQLALALRALAHPARLAMLEMLARAEGCVCGDIVRTLPLAQSTVSQHLKVLVDAGLVRSKSEGTRSSYCIDRAAMAALRDSLGPLLARLSHAPLCGTRESD